MNSYERATVLVHGGPDLASSLISQGRVDDVVQEERFRNGVLGQILAPRR